MAFHPHPLPAQREEPGSIHLLFSCTFWMGFRWGEKMERTKPTCDPPHPFLSTHHGLQVQQLLVQPMDVLILHLDDKVQALQLLLPEGAGAPVFLQGTGSCRVSTGVSAMVHPTHMTPRFTHHLCSRDPNSPCTSQRQGFAPHFSCPVPPQHLKVHPRSFGPAPQRQVPSLPPLSAPQCASCSLCS